jgi:heat shock protein HslJ
MRTVRALLLALALAASAAACAGGGAQEDLDMTGSWELTAGSTADGDIEIIPTAAVTMDVTADDTVTGTSACNRYSSTVVIDGGSVSFGPIAATRMACAPRPNAVEQAYLGALDVVDSGSRDGDELTLTGPDVELVYARRG